MKAGTTVKLSSTNPNRLDTNVKTILSGVAYITSTVNYFGFNFGK